MNRLGGWIIFFLLSGVFVFGVQNMYFHQDDIIYLVQSASGIKTFLAIPANEHLNYVFRVLIWSEWSLFGLNYPLYLLVSVLIHLANTLLLRSLVRTITHSYWVSNLAAILFVVNTNWNETVLWISGQSFTFSILLSLMAYRLILILNEKKFTKKCEIICLVVLLTLPGFTSGVGLWLPISTLLVYGRSKTQKMTTIGKASALSILGLTLAYIKLLDSGIFKYYLNELGLRKLSHIVLFPFLSFFNSVVGRLLVPWDNLRSIRVLLVVILVAWLFKRREYLIRLLQKIDFKFSLISLSIYYISITWGRVIYGLGAARAERYAYLGLIFFIILFSQLVMMMKLKKHIVSLVVLIIVGMQIMGFVGRSRAYFVRPRMVKQLISNIRELDRSTCYKNALLPDYIDEYTDLMYSDLNGLFDEKVNYMQNNDCVDP